MLTLSGFISFLKRKRLETEIGSGGKVAA